MNPVTVLTHVPPLLHGLLLHAAGRSQNSPARAAPQSHVNVPLPWATHVELFRQGELAQGKGVSQFLPKGGRIKRANKFRTLTE